MIHVSLLCLCLFTRIIILIAQVILLPCCNYAYLVTAEIKVKNSNFVVL
jgi:hypothetical protein